MLDNLDRRTKRGYAPAALEEPMFSISVKAASIIACVALGCGEDTPRPGDANDEVLPEGRTFLLGAWAEAYDAAALRPWTASLQTLDATTFVPRDVAPPEPRYAAEAVVIPLDTIGIPWSAFTGPDNRPITLPAPWLAEVERMEGLAAEAGLPVVLALSPLSPEYDTLAPDARDEGGQLILNSAWRPYCYDPATDGVPTRYRDQFAGFARWAAERFSPRMVIVAQRINLYEATCGAAAYGSIVDFAGEAARRIAASEALGDKPITIASVDVEDLYGFPKKDGRCQTGTAADCLAGRKALLAQLEAMDVMVTGLESYPANAFADLGQLPGDWLSRVLAVATKDTAIVGAEVPAQSMSTERGVCSPLFAATEAQQRAFLDQVLSAGAARDMALVAWRHLTDLQPAAVVTSCPCAGDFALCSHLSGLGSKRDERRLRLVGGLVGGATERQAFAVWKALLGP